MASIKEKIQNSKPVQWLIKQTKKWRLPYFKNITVYDLIQQLVVQLKNNPINDRGAAIAYNFIVAIPPSILFFVSLIPELPFVSVSEIESELDKLIVDIVPSPEYNQPILNFVSSLLDGNKIGVLSIGFFSALYFASNGMFGVLRSFDEEKTVYKKRKKFQRRRTALTLTLIVFALVLSYLILLVLQADILYKYVDADLGSFFNYARWILIILLLYAIFGFIYKYGPSLRIRWHFNSPGTVTATILSLIVTLGFTYVVSKFSNYNALYGSLGTIMFVMVLVYLNSVILLFGFEVNVAIQTLEENAQKNNASQTDEAQYTGA